MITLDTYNPTPPNIFPRAIYTGTFMGYRARVSAQLMSTWTPQGQDGEATHTPPHDQSLVLTGRMDIPTPIPRYDGDTHHIIVSATAQPWLFMDYAQVYTAHLPTDIFPTPINNTLDASHRAPIAAWINHLIHNIQDTTLHEALTFLGESIALRIRMHHHRISSKNIRIWFESDADPRTCTLYLKIHDTVTVIGQYQATLYQFSRMPRYEDNITPEPSKQAVMIHDIAPSDHIIREHCFHHYAALSKKKMIISQHMYMQHQQQGYATMQAYMPSHTPTIGNPS